MTTPTTINRPRLIELAKWVTGEERKRQAGEPSEWDQGIWVNTDTDGLVFQDDKYVWSCGTSACAAGHIALLDGGLPAAWDDEYILATEETVWDISSDHMIFDGKPEEIQAHSARALGLDAQQSAELFHGDNNWEDMIIHIASILEIDRPVLVSMAGGEDVAKYYTSDTDW